MGDGQGSRIDGLGKRGSVAYTVGDSLTELERLKVQPKCIITSPPYFNVRNYGSAHQIGYGQTMGDFLFAMERVFRAAYVAARRTATLWIIADSIRKDGVLIPLPFKFIEAAEKSGWRLRSLIVWEKDRTYPWVHDARVRKIHETVVLMTKGKPRLNVDPLRVVDDVTEWWQRYPERYHPRGRVPSDIWRVPIPIQGSWGKPYLRHECPLPPALVSRMIELSTVAGDWVLDPFAGTGVVAATAAVMRRNGQAIDVSAKFVSHFSTEVVPAVDEWWATHELERRRLADARAAFFRANLALRLIKLGRVICDDARQRGSDCIGVWISAGRLRSTPPWARPRLTLIVRPRGGESVRRQAEALLRRAPLSKFGIVASVEVVSQADFESSQSGWIYTTKPRLELLGRATKTKFERMCGDSAHPLIASTLGIDAEDLLKVRTRYWKARPAPGYLASVVPIGQRGRKPVRRAGEK